MFAQNKCLVHCCKNTALSAFDENGNLTEDKNYCIDHIPNPRLAEETIYNYIATHDKIVGLAASGIIFSEIDFSNKQMFGCKFYRCTFKEINADNLLLHMCIFDFAYFNNCNMIKNNSRFTSFSGCTFFHTLFTSSDMIQCNFNGIKAYQTSFDDSDLYSSRFIKSELADSSFSNCNLQNTMFYESKRTNVSFRMSNTREALFEYKENGVRPKSDYPGVTL